ncbi:hypothetical protein YB2330_006610 [Saitoella coloradoensis]
MNLTIALLLQFAFTLLLAATSTSSSDSTTTYIRNSTGIRLQNGFERVYIQPFGRDAFRVRATLWRDPTGLEPGVLLDPPLDGPEVEANGLSYDITLNQTQEATIQNGMAVCNVNGGNLRFYRVEADGSQTLVLEEN